jgi:Fur family peroxide stress response transcriptional regulator
MESNNSKKISRQRLQKLLEMKGVRPSFQRLRILEILAGTTSHPSVDDIYQELLNEIPTLSRTTVYNTLNLMVEKKIVLALSMSDVGMRYDFNTAPHTHFFCNSCSRVIDVDTELPESLLQDSVNGHKIDDTHIYLNGTCKYCLAHSESA